MSDNIKVVVKVRPLISREIEEKLSYQWRVKNDTLYQLDNNGREFGSSFTFDKVYDNDTKTSDIYNDIAKPIVEAATAGFNGTIFAYGQTSSGKTYTMSGSEDSPGIIPLAVFNLFQIIRSIPDRDFLVRVSYIEIYNETLKDLLNVDKKNIKVHENFQGIKVDCTEQVTTSPEEVLKYLKEGEANRQTGATNMNEESSRSHSIFQITIESREHIEGEEEVGSVNVSTLNLVDLAGSERAGQTGATGIRFKEGTHINKSLSALALVIKQLSEDQNKHVNYRDSKLTRILQNSLGGNAKTSIICAITPAAVEETISTLQFANRAKAIKNKPEVNAVATDATMIQSLTKQLSKLQSQLEKKKNLEVILESKMNVEHNLQKQIAALQRLILNGFGTRSSLDMLSSRRKLVPPRRITISTLHPIEENPAPPLPKFHTPLLKYNPMVISGTTDFVPIQNTKKLTCVSEETDNRLVTPPPHDKKVNFSDEIIELDSDDDASTLDGQTCSPYHKCYGSSKTPPCVLRKNAKVAEKNLKDIVELTEREKIYSPNVVELIEKLEQNTTVITSLQEEVNALHKKSRDKDLELDQLQAKVSKSNEEIKSINDSKAELEALCKEYTTKLTDWEVSYETLQNKTKRREQELLSLLEDQKILTKHKKNVDISKPVLKSFDKELNFMDMSKDISLVNSDNESSIVNNDDETSSQFQDLVTDMQNQMTTKNESVLQLQADLLSRKQTITLLENSSHQMQSTVDSLKEKLALVENENSLLKSTLDTLNSTIKIQKSSLESAHSDIESYNSLIQELQIKLTNKEKILNVNINDSTIENMVANEEKFIANNENMKNLIHCFKIALNLRNKEIQLLKSNVTDGSSVDNLKEQLILKEKEINILNNKATALQEEIKNNLNVINKLLEENTNLANSEYQLANKLKEDEEKHCEQNKINLASLESIKAELTIAVADKDALEKEINQKNEELIKKIQELQLKIDYLNQDIRSKDDLISSLNKEDQLSKKNLLKLKSSIAIVNTILENLNIEYKDSIDDSKSDTFDIFEKLLTILKSKIVALTCQKNLDIESNLKLKKELEISNCQLKTEIVELQSKIIKISKELGEYKKVVEQNASEHDYIKSELELKESEILTLKTDLSSSKEDNEKLCSSIKSTEKEIATMLEKENSLSLQMQILMEEKEQKIKDLTQQINVLNDTLKIKDKLISDKDIRIDELVQNLQKIQGTLEEKILETEALSRKVQETIDNESLRLENIFKQSCKLEFLDLKHDSCSDFSNVNLYQNIILRLEQISNYVERMNGKNPKEIESLNEIILEARQEIDHLKQFNKNLQDQLSVAESSNNGLLSELDEIKSENKQLNVDLMEVSKTLDILRNELKEKATDIEIMVTKTQNLKEHFMGLDCVMKNQTKELIEENENLKTRCCELEFIADNSGRGDAQSSVVDDINDIDGQTFTKSQCDVSTLSIENQSPPSLLTICCSKIIDAIQPSEKSVSSTNSKISVELIHFDNRTNSCNCSELLSELKSTQFENLRLSTVVEQLESLNQHLIIEHEEVRREVQLLLKPANELQKKISSHKTNLSTLTATTYAENKSLQSQVTSLQHHHNRFHNVCQKDLPVVKKQLCELLTILKSDNSYTDKHNASFKRFSLPSVFDNNSTLGNLKNESTLDGDLLMLDTNMTLTTSGDNTLMGIDHTCLDITQVYPNNDVACQTADLADVNITENNANQSQMESLFNENKKLSEEINILEQKNIILNREIEEKASQITNLTIKTVSKECETCCYYIEKEKSLNKEIEIITQELSNAKSLKADIEEKYNNLTLEMPSTEALVRKINSLERDWRNKAEEVTKQTNSLDAKNSEIKQLQQEIDSLSTQVMENISESDDLAKELESVKESNAKLLLKCTNLEELRKEAEKQEKSKTFICPRCQMKDEAIKTLQNVEIHSKLNRSLSDSETSSRHNKICTLQNELHAGRQDCKELTEEVATIKSHLERSNLSIGQSMDLDESMGESNIFTFTKQFESIDTPLTKLNMPNVHQNCELDVYTLDKVDCINYIVEKTGANKENLDVNMKVIDLMKLFYNDFLTKHNHEVENFVNKLKCYEESRSQLESHVNEISSEYLKVKKTLEQKENNIKTVTSALSHIRQNIALINEEMSNFEDMENKNTQLVHIFKEKLLKIFDTEFGLTSVTVFEKFIDTVVTKHQNELLSITNQYTKLQTHMESVTSELNTVNNNLLQMKCHLSDRENEYNLLKAQKERVHEISNAVTLDIIRKEQELCDVIEKGCKKLVEHNIMCAGDIDKNLPVNKNMHLLFERIITDYNPSETEQEKENLVLEIKKSKSDLEENIKSLETLKVENDKLKEINKSITLIMVDLENKLKSQESLNKDINSKYDSKVHENETNILKVNKMTDEIKLLKDALVEKENTIRKLESVPDKEVQITELMNKVSTFSHDINNLKSINEIIIKEKETCALELEKCKEVIKNNNEELCKMTSDILVLRESVKENVSIIESLKQEAKSLLQQNLEMKVQLQDKCKDCSRLEMNIKTHEKTAEIQSRMIIRLQKQKEDDDKAISEKSRQVDELTQRYADLQKECETVRSGIKASVEELETLKHEKESLEQRLSRTESSIETAHRPRLSIEAVVETTRRRRQSIHDSKRMFTEGCGDHNKIEAMFDSRPQPQDLFMDVDEDSSNGSTPLRTSRGRDSLISRNDQSDKDDDPPSQSNSVAATRRRRQSIHDLHRSIQTPSPHERPSSRHNDTTHFKSSDVDINNIQSEVAQLRESLSSCQQELEELKEQYRELDEECETCSQYLREREDQCSRLKKEKAALAKLVTELQEKLANPKNNQQERKRSFADAHVNTDEDWANLHSVVVDRMSFDAEVEKNKRLTKTIEELRFKKQDLKNTLAKMQKALEKYAARDYSRELEATKSELRACKQELMELKEKYMELDVECETCSQYLREREEQCRKLKEAKAALEAKLQEYEDASNVSLSLRSKRRTMHDQRRARPAAAAATADNFLTYQVELDGGSHTDEVKLLKSAVDKLSKQKAALEQQLVSVSSAPAPNPMYIATGSAIVQNQQLTDVIKENQKLKKINAKLVVICKKRGKKCDMDSQDISEQS